LSLKGTGFTQMSDWKQWLEQITSWLALKAPTVNSLLLPYIFKRLTESIKFTYTWNIKITSNWICNTSTYIQRDRIFPAILSNMKLLK